MKKHYSFFLLLFASFSITSLQAQNTSPYWSLAGNSNANAASILGTMNNNPLRLYANSSLRAVIATNGYFGIGTATPQQRLHVEGSSNQAIFVSTSALSAISGSGQIGYTKFLPTAAGQRLGYFLTGSRGGANSNYNVAGMLGYADGGWTSSSRPAYLSFETTAPGTTARAERVRIEANGGITVNDPVDNYVLYSVKSGLNSGLLIQKTSTGSGTPCIQGYSTGSSGGVEGFSSTGIGVYGSSTNNYGVYARSSNSTGIYASSAGNSTTEGYAGQFISNNYRGIYVQSATGWYAGYFAGDVFTTGTYVGSDKNLKKNINDVSNAMDIINRLQPKYYEFRNDGNFAKLNLPKGSHYGLLAQDVEKVLPGLVQDASTRVKDPSAVKLSSSNGKETGLQEQRNQGEAIEFKAVNYTELIPIVVKAMQEQQQQINTQQQQIEELKQLVNKLTNGQNINTSLNSATLLQNAPNPVRGTTAIQYSLPEGSGRGQLLLTDALGRTVKAIQLTSAGVVNVDVSALSSGVYNYSLLVDGKTLQTKKMTVKR